MAIDLENLRLDIPDEDFSKPDGVSPTWRLASALFLIAAGAMAYLYFFYQPPGDSGDAIAVRTHTVAFANPEADTEFTAGGWVEPQRPYPVNVSALVPGRIELLFAVEGQDLEGGEVVAMLNEGEYESRRAAAEARMTAAEEEVIRAEARLWLLETSPREEEVEVARAVVERARASLNLMLAGTRDEDIARAEADLREAEAVAEQKRSRADRIRELADGDAFPDSKAKEIEAEARAAAENAESLRQHLRRLKAGFREVDVDEARTELAEAESRLELIKAGPREEEIDDATAALAAAEAKLESAEAELDLADMNLRRCEVTAPQGGRVLEVLSPQGTMLTDRDMTVFTMYDPGQMQCRVDVRQEQAAELFVGQRCTIKLAARRGEPYTGTVLRVNPLANLARDTVRAIVTIDEPDEHLRTDMTVTVDFHPQSDVPEGDELPLVLPGGAIHMRDGKSFVFLVRAGKAELREVELGEETRYGLPVVSGVEQGDMVATTNLAMLHDGASVRLELEAQQ